MIRFALRCAHGHTFESWFDSGDTFDALKAAGHLSCAVCGSTAVEKALMAPSVSPARQKAAPPATAEVPPERSTPPGPRPPALPMAQGAGPDLAALRRHLESISDNVGRGFAAEARRIHEGEAPARPILGEATAEEAKALAEEEIPVTPLPWWQERND